MAKLKSKSINDIYDSEFLYDLEEAVEIVKKASSANFDESVDLAINLNVDPRHAEENIRISTALPKGTGKKIVLLVLAQGEKLQEALDAGADDCGNKDYLDKIKAGWVEVDKIIATPDMMAELGKLGKVLGPKGLMPNPKLGTVATDLSKAVKDIKTGLVEIRNDKDGNLASTIGRKSFSTEKLLENFSHFIESVKKEKPDTIKGELIKNIFLTSTMGISYKVGAK